MNKFVMCLLLCLPAGLTFSPAYSADGKAIYNKSCTGCHGTEVFTRANRRVKNLADLRNRVRQCSYAIETKWFDSEIDAVTGYLNAGFYKF